MNEKVDLTKILKNCPKGFKLYSPLVGEVEFERILDGRSYPIITSYNERTLAFTNEGFYYDDAGAEAECLLFQSAEQRDWSKFTAPWYKKQSEPKFKVGDWLCADELNNYANLIKIVKIVDVFGKKRYKISRDYDSDLDLTEFDFIEKHYHLWTIQDAKDGDVLVNGSNIFIFYFINNRRLMGYCHVNMNDGNFYNDIGRIECFCTIDAPVTPATKKQRNALMKSMNDVGYEWNAETKTLEKFVESRFDPKTLEPFDRVLVKVDSY